MLGRTSGLPGRHGCCQCQLGKEGAAWRSVRRFRTARISASASSSSASQSSSSQYRRDAGPGDAAPSYEDIDNFPLNKVFFTLFRKKVSENVGYDSPVEGYEGLMEVTRVLNTKFKSREEITAVSKAILVSLFPSWLPPAFRVMFAQPFPEFSLFMNAWVTALCCQWLMGKTTVNEVEVLDEDGKTTRMVPGVKVERCRYLEEAGCAAVCMNSCKFPTQEFFIEDMGLPVTLEPDYEDFSCQFVFGKTPPEPEDDEACNTACFSICPSSRAGKRKVCPGETF